MKLDDDFKKMDIDIIEKKNIVAIIAIIVLLATIFFNINDIKSLKGEDSYLDEEAAKNLDLAIAIVILIIVLTSLYLSYKSYHLEKAQGIDASHLKIIALTIAIIPAAMFLYAAISAPEGDLTTGADTFL